MNIIKRAFRWFWAELPPEGKRVPRHARHMHLNIDTALLMTRNPLSTVEYKMKAIVKQCPDGTCKAVLDAALIELYGMPSPDSDITEIGLPAWHQAERARCRCGGTMPCRAPDHQANMSVSKIVANTRYGKRTMTEVIRQNGPVYYVGGSYPRVPLAEVIPPVTVMYFDHKPKYPPTFDKIYRGAELQARYRQLMGDRA